MLLFLGAGDLVLAEFSRDHNWYRARVRKLVDAEKETRAEVFYIDYGNSEVLPLSKSVLLHLFDLLSQKHCTSLTYCHSEHARPDICHSEENSEPLVGI